MARKYSSVSTETTLASGISNSATTMTVATGTGSALLGGVTLGASNVDQFTVAIDPDTASEEIVFITGVTSDTLTITRGQAGTSAITHSGGAAVKHVLTSDDLNYFESTVSAATTATGTATLTNKTITLGNNTITGSTAQFNTALTDGDFATLAGTETLTNKTLTSPTANDPKLNLTVNAQTGTTYTFVLADNGKFVTADNGSAQTYSIPTNASVAFPVGTQIHIIQIGAGQVTINAVTPGTTTVLSAGSTAAAPKIAERYGAATCIKTATDTWYVIGNIA